MDLEKQARYRRLFSYKQSLTDRATPAERKFEELLKELGISYRFQKGVFTTDAVSGKRRFRIIDFYITRCRLGIEIDGPNHHTHMGKEKDTHRANEIFASRPTISFWRFTNEEVLAESPNVLKNLENLKRVQDFRTQNRGTKFIEVEAMLQQIR